MLIIAIILLGMLAGFAGRWIVGQLSSASFSASEAFAAGIGGSFVGGLLGSLLAGDGLEIRLSGLVGSVVGAVLILTAWGLVRGRSSQ